ncbi:MAG: hypothetical protein QM661_09965 [Solimonas sp.]
MLTTVRRLLARVWLVPLGLAALDAVALLAILRRGRRLLRVVPLLLLPAVL